MLQTFKLQDVNVYAILLLLLICAAIGSGAGQ